MKPVNDNLVRPVSAVQNWARDPGYAGKRFERVMHTGERHGQTAFDDEPPAPAPEADSDGGDGQLAPGVLRLFRQSLESDSSEFEGGGLLACLLGDIAGALRVGRRMPGDRWRLLLRLREDLLAQTELEIACTGGELSVVIRTAQEASYRRLVAVLPELNAALERRDLGERCATVFWVGPVELRV